MTLAVKSGRRGQFVHHQFEHAIIEHAHQPDALGHRNDLVRVGEPAVGRLHAHQAFVEGDLAALGLDHRLKGERDAPLVERGDDLVGRAHAVAAQRVALHVRPIGGERAVPLVPRGMQRILSVRLRTSGTVRAWRGAVTPPMVTVAATGPAAVKTVSSRTPASSRSAATSSSSAVQVVRMTPNLLPEKRPRKSLPRSRARMRLATCAITSSATS